MSAFPVCIAILLGVAACQPDEPDSGARILPEAAAPGSSVVIDPRVKLQEIQSDAVRVRVGEHPALVLDIAPEAGVAFLVPDHPPGEAEVTVEIAGDVVGTATLSILAPPARHLVLTMRGDRIELVSNRGAGGLGRPSRDLPVGPALAYDVITESGVLLATGALSHPLKGRREVFEEDGTMHGVPEPESATFTLRIKVQVFAGVNNLFDKLPPVLGFRAGGDASTNVTLFDPIGRRYFLGARVGF